MGRFNSAEWTPGFSESLVLLSDSLLSNHKAADQNQSVGHLVPDHKKNLKIHYLRFILLSDLSSEGSFI